ncbi:hypothetical protein GGR54DRAFT_314405 [Hypoxylon sp. NC1633]|nr:hypothetical protein GGR54DRAFT_314405 [Hypoxylon sp. NC1633]
MQFTTFLAAAAALAMGTNAAAIKRDGARMGQFRIFGADGCKELNDGFYTVDESDKNTCYALTGTVVKSLTLEALNYPAANGCSFFIYTDAACGAGRRSLETQVCNDVPAPAVGWGSWQLFCPTGAAGAPGAIDATA